MDKQRRLRIVRQVQFGLRPFGAELGQIKAKDGRGLSKEFTGFRTSLEKPLAHAHCLSTLSRK